MCTRSEYQKAYELRLAELNKKIDSMSQQIEILKTLIKQYIVFQNPMSDDEDYPECL